MSLGKEFCVWLVHPDDRKVRKIRFTKRMAVIGIGIFSLVVASVVFITGDYARLQAARLKSHFFLQKVTAERDRLRNRALVLESRLRSRRNHEGLARAASSSRHGVAPSSPTDADPHSAEVREKLKQLAEIIESATSLHLFGAETDAAANGEEKEKSAVGGPEDDCRIEDSECVALFSDPKDERASLSWDLLIGEANASEPTPRDHLLAQLDRSIQVLRSLPIGFPAGGGISSGFGYRHSPFGRGLKMHRGLDFADKVGSPIVATGDGVVSAVKRLPTYGLMIDIDHSSGVVTRYAHLSQALVKEGARVERGSVIGLVGSTGRSTGPHLHYEVRVDGKPRNPMRFVKLAEELEGIL